MRHRPLLLAIPVISFLAAQIELAPSRAADSALRFNPDVRDAWRSARTTHRPLLLFITHDGCRYCRKMQHETFAHPGVISDVEKTFVPATLDASEEPGLVKRFKVRRFPTTVVLGPQGKVWGVVPGYVSAAELQSKLRAMKRQHIARLRKFHATRGNDPPAGTR